LQKEEKNKTIFIGNQQRYLYFYNPLKMGRLPWHGPGM
jgi:hypothetical protein